MKRVFMFSALFGLTCLAAVAQLEAPIDVPAVPTKVTVVEQAVKPATVAVSTIIIAFKEGGEATVQVVWQWKAADGTVVKRGVRSFTEAELNTILETKGMSVAALKALFAEVAKADAEAPE